MNTAARASSHWFVPVDWTGVLDVNWRQVLIGLLAALIVVSAFMIVYMKDVNRRLLINYQQQTAQQQQFEITRGQLLLEESTWARQSRVQRIAENDLNMVMPAGRDIVLLQTKNLPKVANFSVLSSEAVCGSGSEHAIACLQNHIVVDS